MSMTIHEVAQGTPEWHALRLEHFTASEAPAMMGASKQISRTELLHAKKTGLDKDVHWWVQRYLFDRGHEAEAMARPIVERMIGEDLYPVVGTMGKLLASMDGMTMLGDVLFEHKMWNEELARQVRAGELDPHYYWQLEQQLLVAEAERAIFVVSDGTEENMVYLWYTPVEGRAKQLVDGWKQFEADLAEFVPAEPKPQVVGRTPETLPALRIEVTGMVTASNLTAFREHALAVLGNINTDLSTDQHFADADKTVKWCKDVEQRLEAAKAHALSQTASIDELFRTLDAIAEEARAKRLELDKLVKARKETIRLEIKTKAEQALAEHIAAINKRLGKVQLAHIATDFAGAIKGKKTVASLQDACDTELARAKIEASTAAESIEANLASLRELAKDHGFLFADIQQLVLKANDDLVALIKTRIADHETDRQRQEAQRAAQPLQDQAVEQAQGLVSVAKELDREQRQTAPAAAATQAADDGRRIKLGDINARLGFSLTADFLRSIGFEPAGRERAAVLYRADDFPRICSALIAHINNVGQRQNAA